MNSDSENSNQDDINLILNRLYFIEQINKNILQRLDMIEEKIGLKIGLNEFLSSSIFVFANEKDMQSKLSTSVLDIINKIKWINDKWVLNNRESYYECIYNNYKITKTIKHNEEIILQIYQV